MRSKRLFSLLEDIHPLSEAFKETLGAELLEVVYPKNHFLVQVHSIAHHAYFLERGFAVAYYFSDLKKVVTSFFGPGEIVFAPGSLFAQAQSNLTIQLTVDSVLLLLPFGSLNKLFDRFPEANYLARVITATFHSNADERIFELHTLSAWDRYQKLLKRYPGIELHATQDLIASYLNITPQSLSRLRTRRNRS